MGECSECGECVEWDGWIWLVGWDYGGAEEGVGDGGCDGDCDWWPATVAVSSPLCVSGSGSTSGSRSAVAVMLLLVGGKDGNSDERIYIDTELLPPHTP